MDRHESRNTVLYVRVKKSNHKWVVGECRRLGFKSKSEYMDCLITLAQEGKKRQHARKARRISSGR